mmetsp:Transcript_5486/g.12595  ORF Transcript_5486/g.12595 Transcript_5486/m.12595 type:complete len:203 (+) Transcript_5486:1389-1997(+)
MVLGVRLLVLKLEIPHLDRVAPGAEDGIGVLERAAEEEGNNAVALARAQEDAVARLAVVDDPGGIAPAVHDATFRYEVYSPHVSIVRSEIVDKILPAEDLRFWTLPFDDFRERLSCSNELDRPVGFDALVQKRLRVSRAWYLFEPIGCTLDVFVVLAVAQRPATGSDGANPRERRLLGHGKHHRTGDAGWAAMLSVHSSGHS